MMWICRSGSTRQLIENSVHDRKIFLAWDGYNVDLSKYRTKEDVCRVIAEEKGINNRKSISNWYRQIYSFVFDMQIGDYVMIPFNHSRQYVLAKIASNYSFDPNNTKNLYHSRDIEIIHENVFREWFPQTVQFSLNAFKTVYKVKVENEVIDIIRNHEGSE